MNTLNEIVHWRDKMKIKITKIELTMIIVFLTIVWFGWGQFQI